MGLYHWGLPPFLLEWAASQGVRAGVESGTFEGDSALAIAAAVGSCTTIELADGLFEQAARRFAGDRRVTVLHGSSADLLPDVCVSVSGPTLFWLDGHYSGGVTAGGGSECPVLAELDAVAALPEVDQHIVFVDDARLFGFVPSVPPGRHDWPSLYVVLDRLEAMGLRTYVVDDVVVGIGPQRVESFEALLFHPQVRQHLVLHRDWPLLRFVLRWGPRALRRRLPGAVRRRVKRAARRVLPHRLRRRLRRLLRRWR